MHLSGPETYAVVLKSGGHPVGCVGFLLGEKSNLVLPDGEAELGYWLGAPFRSRGLIPEAVNALVRRAFDDLRLRKIWCGTPVPAGASVNTITFRGFEEEFSVIVPPSLIKPYFPFAPDADSTLSDPA